MSNSIWKMPEETPKDFCDVVLANSRTGSCCVFFSPFHNVSFDYDKWCYVDELIAQADKAERLQKAVDLALGWLEKVATPAKCDDDLCREFTKRKINEIKQLIKE